jgi:hypothetical protein
VTITDVRVFGFGQPRNYSAIYTCPRRPGDSTSIYGRPPMDSEPMMAVSMDYGKYAPACSEYLRISSEDGTKLGGAGVIGGASSLNPIVADRYGRVFLAAPLKSTRRVAVSAAGHSTESIDVSCGERAVVLYKNP